MQIRGHFIRSVSRLGLPCPGTRSPRGWLPRLAAKLAGGTLGPWLPPPLRPARLSRCPPRPGLTRRSASPVPRGEEKGVAHYQTLFFSNKRIQKNIGGGLRPECNKINNLLNHKGSFCAQFDGLLSRERSFCATFNDIYDRQERRMRRLDTMVVQSPIQNQPSVKQRSMPGGRRPHFAHIIFGFQAGI